MKSDNPTGAASWRRIALGILALVCLSLGGAWYLIEPSSASGISGMLVRLGFLMAAIWLAMPQVGRLTFPQSAGAVIIAAVLILLAASRPNVFRVAATILVVGLALNWALKWLAILGKTNR